MFSRLFAALLALACLSSAVRADSIDTPVGRQLGASEPMSSPGVVGTDYSANKPAISGTLLATIPALTAKQTRRGYTIQAQCTAGLTVVFDDGAGTGTTIMLIAGPASDGEQGGAIDYSGMPHTSRIRIYSSNASCQMAARAW